MALDMLEELRQKLETVVNERREEENARAAEAREKAEKLAFYQELLMEEGINPAELVNSASPSVTGKRNAQSVRRNTVTMTKMVRFVTGRVRAERPP